MKKLALFVVALVFSGVAFSQNPAVVSAFNWLKDNKLDKALAAIEPATTHPQTMSSAKTWLYRGNIYLNIALTDNESFKALCSNPLDSAYNSYQKSIMLDKDYIAPTANPNSAKLGLFYLGDQYFNVGANHYNNKDWAEARKYFERTKQIKNTFGEKDSLATFYATNCALQMGDNETAMKYLKELINMDYQKPEIYSMLGNLYKDAGDTTKMLNTIAMGRKRFPADLGLIISETNYYLGKGELAKAQDLLKVAVEKDPNNPILHFTIGSNYDRLSLDTNVAEAEKESMLAEAEKAYLKAIELKADFFDAYYNLGALFFNKGVEVFELANSIPPDQFDAYEKAKTKYMEYWNKSVPYLEKASELMPDDLPTLQALKSLYARLNMPEKLKTVTDKINTLKQ
ncbi:MAG: tetratricopeptide repeat protein [Bacteroidales bacterium]|nr:tetratricopeptide repeat protein [Bacteroidales bacterium]